MPKILSRWHPIINLTKSLKRTPRFSSLCPQWNKTTMSIFLSFVCLIKTRRREMETHECSTSPFFVVRQKRAKCPCSCFFFLRCLSTPGSLLGNEPTSQPQCAWPALGRMDEPGTLGLVAGPGSHGQSRSSWPSLGLMAVPGAHGQPLSLWQAPWASTLSDVRIRSL